MTRIRNRLAIATFVGITVLASFCLSRAAGPAAPAAPPPSDPLLVGEEGPLVPEGAPADIAIIYTGGVVGYVEPCG